ncbi:MAG: U32 family peptidase, partial [Prevotella sp.]|nr:U32 family peptidase [Prevotella sp.]
MTSLELLSPARNLECGISAIDHGADAVYIGAHKFGARAAAGNSIEDIASLCHYAHKFGAKVYVTVNTIIFDDEIHDTVTMVKQLKEAGADAILIQDMGLYEELMRSGININIHASTPTDNRTVEKVRWLSSLGIKRTVLARELSIE